MAFSIEYDAAVLGLPTVAPGAAMPADVAFTVNSNEPGRIRVLLDSVQELATSGTSASLVVITFELRASMSRETTLNFGPANECSAADNFAERLKIKCGGNEGLTLVVRPIIANISRVTPFGLRTDASLRLPISAAHGGGIFF